MRGRVNLLLGAMAVVVIGCSVVDDGKVSRINPPLGLDDTLPPITDAVTTTSELATTTTGPATTTTLVQTEQVRLYFIASGQLTYVVTPLPAPVALNQVIAALQMGPPRGELGTGLRSAVPPLPAEIRVTSDGSGVLTVTLPPGFFDTVAVGSDQRLVIGQLVLTLTDTRGIGQVVFNQAVPLPSGEVISAGQPLAYRDYQSLAGSNPSGTESVGGTPSATTSSTTISTDTSTSAPPP